MTAEIRLFNSKRGVDWEIPAAGTAVITIKQAEVFVIRTFIAYE